MLPKNVWSKAKCTKIFYICHGQSGLPMQHVTFLIRIDIKKLNLEYNQTLFYEWCVLNTKKYYIFFKANAIIIYNS